MTVLFWRGDAPAVAQVSSVTVTADSASTTYKITINSKVVSVTGTGTGVNDTASAIVAALQASTIPEFQEVAWTVSSATVIGTANTAGMPFTYTATVSGGTGTFSAVSTTAGSGPNDLSLAANYSTGALPTNGDTLYMTDSTNAALYNADALAAVTLTNLYIDASMTGAIGLPRNSVNGYVEYRARYFKIGATNVYIGLGSGSGSGRIRLDQGTAQTTWNVYTAGSSIDTGQPAIVLKGTHASNVLNLQKGLVGVATDDNDTATVATVRVGSQAQRASDANLTLGPGCTLTNIKQYGGVVQASSNVSSWENFGGTSYMLGGTLASMVLESSAAHYHSSTSAFTDVSINNKCVFDVSRDPRAKSCNGAFTLYAGANVQDPNATIVYTGNPMFELVACTFEDVTLNVGVGKHFNFV